jgi:hypothetical protein
MKWFKHDSDASNDAKLKKLRLKYGAQGYGIYWYCLELIARNVEKHNLTFELEHDAELIADDFKLSADLVQHIMTYMVELELFENTDGIISCLKMATRTDEYTQKLIHSVKKCPDNVTTMSIQSPTKSVLIEEKREEKNIIRKHEDFDVFYKSYPKKKNRGDAEKAWNSLKPDLQSVLNALEWQKKNIDWTKEDGKYIPYPASYLRSRAWEDEKPAPKKLVLAY